MQGKSGFCSSFHFIFMDKGNFWEISPLEKSPLIPDTPSVQPNLSHELNISATNSVKSSSQHAEGKTRSSIKKKFAKIEIFNYTTHSTWFSLIFYCCKHAVLHAVFVCAVAVALGFAFSCEVQNFMCRCWGVLAFQQRCTRGVPKVVLLFPVTHAYKC